MATVAVDINPATRAVVTGTEKFTREVCRRLPAAAPDLRWRFLASRPKAGLGVDELVIPQRRLWSQVRLPLALLPERPDLLFVPAHVIPYAWPGKVLTVVHDLAFEKFPDAYAFAERSYLRLSTRWAVMRCKLLVAVSETTKRDLIDLYGVPEDRVRVVPLGMDPPSVTPAPASRLAELGIDGKFLLQVGRIEKRKNQLAAVAAVERLDGVKLVVAGPERDPELSAQLRGSAHARVLGMVDQSTLELLYNEAAAVIVPSLYEGFGLPVLEAMARGKVVVAAMASSLPEVGGEAVLYYHPTADPAHVAQVLETAIDDRALRTRLAKAAQARAAKFTWDRTARDIAAVIKELVGPRGSMPPRSGPGQARPAAPPR